MLAFCYFIIHKTMAPVVTLAKQTEDIAEGHFDRQIAPSTRLDEVGRLQNSFHTMQQSIVNYVAELEATRTATEQKNEELTAAKALAEESDQKKAAFIRDMFHQIRTPLNIISGFAQVLRDGHSLMEGEDFGIVIGDIILNGQNIGHIIDNWKMTLELEQMGETPKNDVVDCNELCQEVAYDIVIRQPETVEMRLESTTSNLMVTTNREYLIRILSELLHNANKFTDEGYITIGCGRKGDGSVRFYVADSGPGIPEADRERVFTQFVKLNNFNEGLGMGLYLCRQLAHRLGGTLEIDPLYVGGTRMVLTLQANEL
jgi:signal transduction histidine kinase